MKKHRRTPMPTALLALLLSCILALGGLALPAQAAEDGAPEAVSTLETQEESTAAPEEKPSSPATDPVPSQPEGEDPNKEEPGKENPNEEEPSEDDPNEDVPGEEEPGEELRYCADMALCALREALRGCLAMRGKAAAHGAPA